MRVGVVGGGITGLAIAHELVKRGHQPTLFERGAVGGLAGGFPYPACPGTHLDKFYHHIFRGDEQVVRLIEEAGLAQDLLWLPSKSGLIAHGACGISRAPGICCGSNRWALRGNACGWD